MVNHEKEYALYKGDKLLGIGTAHELSDLLKVKVATIHFYSTPSYSNRTKPNRARRLIPLDEEKE